jgi:hypothetical protein
MGDSALGRYGWENTHLSDSPHAEPVNGRYRTAKDPVWTVAAPSSLTMLRRELTGKGNVSWSRSVIGKLA